MKIEGFEPMTLAEQKAISAGFGLSDIIPSIISGMGSIVNVADDISTTIIKNKIIAKMDQVKKGEVEIGKDGQIRLKWDSVFEEESSGPQIIF